MSAPQDFSRGIAPTPPCTNDPVANNKAALAGMSDGSQKGSDSIGGNQSLLSGISSGLHEHGKAKHGIGTVV